MTENNSFKNALLDKSGFCVTWEQIPGRDVSKRQEILGNALLAASEGLIKAVSITDNPGGNPAYPAAMLGAEIIKLGIEPLVHFTLRDKNRNDVESMINGLNAAGVRNLLVLSGDYPAGSGFAGLAKPVFDLDPAHMLQLLSSMNGGLEYEALGKWVRLPATDFFAGVAVSPFKKLEAEIMGQYFKLDKKIRAGAGFVISQVGYDARKMQELVLWLEQAGHDIPALANIYVLSYATARLMNENKIPGCVVTGTLLEKLSEERKAQDKGKQARLIRASKMYAIAKGIGYRGAHIGGHGLSYEDVKFIIATGEELSVRWQDLTSEFDDPQPGGFYLFRRDKKTSMNTREPALAGSRGKRSFLYDLSRIVHNLMLEPKNPLFSSYQRLAARVDRTGGIKKALTAAEHLNKVLLYDCQACGDCALEDTGYLCPVSQCPKVERVGPCGGSFEGWCEVYPRERQCVWVRAYDRLKAYGELEKLKSYIVSPRDWSLDHTSSWLNYYLGRDHTAKRTGIKPPSKNKA